MIMRLFATGILLAVMAMLLRSFGFRGAVTFSLFAVVVILSAAAGELSVLLDNMGLGALFSGEAARYTTAIAKVVGCGYLFGIAADMCRELGEVGIAKAVILGGRIEILLIAAPYFAEILRIGQELIS